MKKVILIILLVIFQTYSKTSWYPYLSPGFKLGWDFKYGISTSFKMSIGIHDDQDFSFVNITPGISVNHECHYIFAEIESGYPVPNIPVYIGGGLGIAFYSSNSINKRFMIVPKGSLFAGALLFWLRDDFVIVNRKSLRNDLGLIVTYPITKYKLDFTSD